MPEQKESVAKYVIVIATGVISLVVGVSSGLLLDVFREHGADLTYVIASSDDFVGQVERSGIAVITVSNPGRKEAEDFLCRLNFPTAILKEHKILGLSTAHLEIQRTEHSIDLKLPYLNPHETFTIQLLLAPEIGGTARPEIQLRGKGILGHQTAPAGSGRSASDLLKLSVTAGAAIVPAFLLLSVRLYRRMFPKSAFTTQHLDDQRDVFAYVLGSCGLLADAAKIRIITREMSYWALADHLTEEWLQANDSELIRKGVSALQRLLEYASMADTSTWLIQTDIARLAASLGDTELTKKSLQEAMRLDHNVVLLRAAHDENLNAILQTIKSNRSSGKGI